ncbi:hypothetical protein FHX49_000367 [Microbacterium endophyticum]|uniref:Uncharacterized protein n=1 Tax=Microbacterium endophyticum TaxID=1526412 RepID=A0A7W4V0W0_9MICO|nr:hypothetical protein [Microbacterium endophyticum]NIK37123.1 hypothetical protein [Microbacterium endophyticum]
MSLFRGQTLLLLTREREASHEWLVVSDAVSQSMNFRDLA